MSAGPRRVDAVSSNIAYLMARVQAAVPGDLRVVEVMIRPRPEDSGGLASDVLWHVDAIQAGDYPEARQLLIDRVESSPAFAWLRHHRRLWEWEATAPAQLRDAS